VDDTGAALQAFAAAGMRGSKATRRAVAFLRAAQNKDAGFGLLRGQASNAQSTSWAVQGIIASGRSPAGFKKRGRTPLAFLRSLQASDGSVRYSRSSVQTPVWVTAQALDAFEGKAFPLAPAARAAPARGGGGEADDNGSDKGGGTGGGGSAPKPSPKKPPASSAPPAAAPSEPAPATPTGPTGPTGTAGAAASPPAVDADRMAGEAMDRIGSGGGGSPWLPIAILAGVAALATWRLLRRRAPREPSAAGPRD
jgi:hypothetical protein